MTRKKAMLYILLPILAFSAGYLLKPATPATREAIPDIAKSPPTKPLAFFTTVVTPKGTIYLIINQDYIYLNAADTPYYPNAPVINKENYPRLFKQGVASSSALRVEYYKEAVDGTYLKLSSTQPDHGGFSDAYAILVDPFTGVIKESKSIDKFKGVANF